MLAAGMTAIIAYMLQRPNLPTLPWLIGPVVVDILVGGYTLVAFVYSRPGDDWLIIPVFVAFVAVLIWHVVIVVRGPGRAVLAAYGVAHMSFWMLFGVACMLRISKDNL